MNFFLRHRELALALIIAAMVGGIGVYAPAFCVGGQYCNGP